MIMCWDHLRKFSFITIAVFIIFICKPFSCNKINEFHFYARGGLTTDSQTPEVKVVFQGEPGAYSEKSLRELLGTQVTAIGKPSFEDAFRAVASREADYALLPVENTLGGSIHANYDLQLKYNLHIVAEHEFRVEHSLLALPGTKLKDVKKVMSHPQALSQCDGYLRGLGVEKVPKYDTAGSAKMIKEQNLVDCAAIASDIAAETYGMEVLESNIEDDECNFTRFLLLSRQPVNSYLSPQIAAKTSLVFTLNNQPGALYKALACFSLRDIDFSKIESRPTSANLLQYLRFQQQQMGGTHYFDRGNKNKKEPRFSYCFYLDILTSMLDEKAQLALSHLKEQAGFVRVLGTYPSGSQLVGPIKEELNALSKLDSLAKPVTIVQRPGEEAPRRLKIGIVGFGKFGQFLAEKLIKYHDIVAMDKDDKEIEARELGVGFYSMFEGSAFFATNPDVIVVATSILSFEAVLRSMPADMLRGKLIVDVLSIKMHPKQVMQELLPPDCDILCTHPMFGPESTNNGWQGLPLVFDKIRISDFERCQAFLNVFEGERCKMVEMSAEMHDRYSANGQFVTHLMGRVLGEQNLMHTPIDTKAYGDLLHLVERTCSDSFDLFYGLFKYNPQSGEQLRRLREAFAHVERQLAAKEAYLTAKAEMAQDERQKLMAEARSLIRGAISSNLEYQDPINHDNQYKKLDQEPTPLIEGKKY
mmetsp:Transcript_18204/g.23985  ORF Transcript_18204/g.23985 Transcript_18204/m.23985 type:complete len:701 (+) Transcript_18204:119-2221(+)